MEYCLDSMRETYSNFHDCKSQSLNNHSAQSLINSRQSPLRDDQVAADFGRKSLLQAQLERLQGSFDDNESSDEDSDVEDPIEELLKSIENNSGAQAE